MKPGPPALGSHSGSGHDWCGVRPCRLGGRGAVPERLNGLDEAAGDLFSLGVTLYQAVEGVSPFRRDTPTATLGAVALTQAPPPARAGALAPLITGLMAREPRDRPTPDAALKFLNGGGPTVVNAKEVPPTVPDPAPPVAQKGARLGHPSRAAS